jgi:hypothetical protein
MVDNNLNYPRKSNKIGSYLITQYERPSQTHCNSTIVKLFSYVYPYRIIKISYASPTPPPVVCVTSTDGYVPPIFFGDA